MCAPIEVNLRTAASVMEDSTTGSATTGAGAGTAALTPASINCLTSNGGTPAAYSVHLTASMSPARRAACALCKVSGATFTVHRPYALQFGCDASSNVHTIPTSALACRKSTSSAYQSQALVAALTRFR